MVEGGVRVHLLVGADGKWEVSKETLPLHLLQLEISGFLDDLIFTIDVHFEVAFFCLLVDGEDEVGCKGEIGLMPLYSVYLFNQLN